MGNTETLTANVEPATATNKTVTWSSSNASVATVNANGLVTATGVGTANITVTTQDGAKTATCAVTVTGTAQVRFNLVTNLTGAYKVTWTINVSTTPYSNNVLTNNGTILASWPTVVNGTSAYYEVPAATLLYFNRYDSYGSVTPSWYSFRSERLQAGRKYTVKYNQLTSPATSSLIDDGPI